jgi:hypothetical protein
MNNFSDLPRYPADSIDEPDGPSGGDGSIRGAVTIAQIVGEVLFLAAPLLTLLWFVVCLPLLVALILTAPARDEHR